MGRFSTTTQIKNNTDRAGFISAFNAAMEKRGFVPCEEDEAAKSYLLAFSEGGWVTFTSESDDVPKIVADMNSISFSVEVVDSDFAIIKLSKGSKEVDTVIVGDGSGYGFEEDSPKGEKKCWELLLADGKTWDQLSEIWAKDEVFVEDALCKSAPVLGINPKYMVEDYNELLDMADNDENIATLHFKEKSTGKESKPMTLNAAFKKVFGEALEPLGFKLIKSKYPYFVRVIGDEILHIVTYRQTSSPKLGYKEIEIYCGVVTLYRRKIDFTMFPTDWLENSFFIFRDFPNLDIDRDVMERAIQFKCDIWGTDKDWILKRETFNDAFRNSIGQYLCSSTDRDAQFCGLKNAFDVTKSIILAVMDKVTDLDSCVDYFYKINQDLSLCPFDEFITSRLYSKSEGLMLIKAGYRGDRVEQLQKRLASIKDYSPYGNKEDFELYCKRSEDFRAEQYAYRIEMLDNPEINKRVLDELERRKANHIEMLKSYGLDI